jgi:hypothetical protein
MKNLNSDERGIGLDRIATWDEVRYAMALSSQAASQLGCTSGGDCDLESDFTGRFGVRPKKLARVPLISEKLDPKSN